MICTLIVQDMSACTGRDAILRLIIGIPEVLEKAYVSSCEKYKDNPCVVIRLLYFEDSRQCTNFSFGTPYTAYKVLCNLIK